MKQELNKEVMKMKTDEFSATIGVVSGYIGEERLKEFKKIDRLELAKVWQKEAKKEMEASGVYVSAVINYSQSLYSTDWGCPIGGEPTYTLEGSRNPQFCKDSELWKNSVRNIVKAVKNHFNQSTVTLNFRTVEQEYIK